MRVRVVDGFDACVVVVDVVEDLVDPLVVLGEDGNEDREVLHDFSFGASTFFDEVTGLKEGADLVDDRVVDDVDDG